MLLASYLVYLVLDVRIKVSSAFADDRLKVGHVASQHMKLHERSKIVRFGLDCGGSGFPLLKWHLRVLGPPASVLSPSIAEEFSVHPGASGLRPETWEQA
ncbi:MAG: hypothetical protein FWD17_10410, partial [Polyangiaceae bacterium]|nr:hypothetical protein [Polyangiaceae bacterium]